MPLWRSLRMPWKPIWTPRQPGIIDDVLIGFHDIRKLRHNGMKARSLVRIGGDVELSMFAGRALTPIMDQMSSKANRKAGS